MMSRSLGLAVVALLVAFSTASAVCAQSQNGAAGDMPAYYDCKLFTINLKELPPSAEQATLANNTSINTIYMSDQAEAEGFNFVSVLDAIQGDGFNPLWQEVQIVFNVPPFQLCSDDEIAAAAADGEITLEPTNEVYRCSVVGAK